jgi:hypothetical protein
MATFRAPAGNGEVLAVPDFAAVAGLVEENRRKLDRDDVTIGGLPLRELRALARREVLELAADTYSVPPSSQSPLFVTGHQPELAHPGVWVKNFALTGLAKKLGGTALHLIADTDTLKSTSLRFPVFRDRDAKSVRLESLAFDTFSGAEPYETRRVEDAERQCPFDSFADRSRPLWSNWGYKPLLWEAWHPIVHHYGPSALIGVRFAGVRQEYEQQWGCRNLELTVSSLSQTDAFARFASHILGDLPRFREVYNAAIRAYRGANHIRSDNHPAPELREGEAPFWVRTAGGRRERATPTSDVRNLRPRALTLTLFARVCLGDFFIHGIGGGKYDEVTDAIIRDYFHIEPPAYQVLSATLHLPLPGFPSTPDDLKRAERRVRDLHWNPQRYLSPENLARPEVRSLLERKAALATAEPPRTDHAARREWFRALQKVTEELRPFVAKREPEALGELERVRAEVAANEVLQRRDYSWVLYPEETLRPFLRQFLNV